jgi:nitrite reductase/ring-hydroxylating ferredoxin subunit
MSGEFTPALPLAELQPGKMRAVSIGGREILLCHTKEGVSALDNVCTHAYARMSEGRLRGSRLICPLHGASFDARTGAVLAPPASQPLCRHGVRVIDGMIEVAVAPAAPIQVGV